MTTRILATLAVILIPMAANAAEPALGGNCPVCLVETGKAVPGSDKHTATFDRQVYYFPSAKEKEMFLANPVKYAPVLGGDCVRLTGDASTVMAVQDGKIAAKGIHAMLETQALAAD